ncbi:hypothetical protein NDU88_003205 [Pleurodeles waltl]|uniref:Uncharacterized protein n=1 Tax=Pleurodeles waltl TaxID=8319 RepID=A0AAV7TPW0_PLEWA|nr:hypothetical protein NDU88_003205 [Pleurodeles waltl]
MAAVSVAYYYRPKLLKTCIHSCDGLDGAGPYNSPTCAVSASGTRYQTGSPPIREEKPGHGGKAEAQKGWHPGREANEERDGGADEDVLERTREPFLPIGDKRTGESREPFVPIEDRRTRETRELFVPIGDGRTGETREPFIPIGDGRI